MVVLSTTARWFVRYRGMMSGIVNIGSHVGTMTAPPVIASLITGYGWKEAYLVLVLLLLGIACLSLTTMLLAGKHRPLPRDLEMEMLTD